MKFPKIATLTRKIINNSITKNQKSIKLKKA